jgi:hypothetical protein
MRMHMHTHTHTHTHKGIQKYALFSFYRLSAAPAPIYLVTLSHKATLNPYRGAFVFKVKHYDPLNS